MDSVKIAATSRTPEVDFDFAENRYRLAGESYPENVAEFYAPLLDRLKAHYGKLRQARIEFAFELLYFNSSSAKTIMGLFDLLEETALAGNPVAITWACEEGDDMQETGEEFAEDLEAATFSLRFLEK